MPEWFIDTSLLKLCIETGSSLILVYSGANDPRLLSDYVLWWIWEPIQTCHPCNRLIFKYLRAFCKLTVLLWSFSSRKVSCLYKFDEKIITVLTLLTPPLIFLLINTKSLPIKALTMVGKRIVEILKRNRPLVIRRAKKLYTPHIETKNRSRREWNGLGPVSDPWNHW